VACASIAGRRIDLAQQRQQLVAHAACPDTVRQARRSGIASRGQLVGLLLEGEREARARSGLRGAAASDRPGTNAIVQKPGSHTGARDRPRPSTGSCSRPSSVALQRPRPIAFDRGSRRPAHVVDQRRGAPRPAASPAPDTSSVAPWRARSTCQRSSTWTVAVAEALVLDDPPAQPFGQRFRATAPAPSPSTATSRSRRPSRPAGGSPHRAADQVRGRQSLQGRAAAGPSRGAPGCARAAQRRVTVHAQPR